MYPGSNVVVVTPVAPHNLNDRPWWCRRAKSPLWRGPRRTVLLSMDSRSYPLEPGRVRIKPAGFSVTLINLEHQDFSRFVKNALGTRPSGTLKSGNPA